MIKDYEAYRAMEKGMNFNKIIAATGIPIADVKSAYIETISNTADCFWASSDAVHFAPSGDALERVEQHVCSILGLPNSLEFPEEFFFLGYEAVAPLSVQHEHWALLDERNKLIKNRLHKMGRQNDIRRYALMG